MSLSNDIISINDNNFLENIKGKKPLFISVISNIETTKYLPISGVNRKVIKYTPAADMELVTLGRSISLPSPPVDATMCPSPATITRANVHLKDIPVLTVDAGSEVKPKIPPSTYIPVDRKPTGDISKGLAMENSKRLFEVGREVGKRLIAERDFQVAIIGECVPGGTTSALGVLLGLGYDAEEKVSSGSVKNPKELKLKVVREGLKRAKSPDVFDILNAVGDKMMPVVAGMVFSLVEYKRYVILGGGTQMASVLAVIKEIDRKYIKEGVLDTGCISIGTTEFLLKDKNSDIKGLIEEIGGSIPLYASRFYYERSKIGGLKAYCRGAVKEGVGAGGISVYSYVNGLSSEDIREYVEMNYHRWYKVRN
ncbi:TIGR00303 family protein [Methanofervidicoccus sp. A16]|uniref:nicotinate mononucleotide-dependent phosphoribosyltransferase CobT n=1 Tax=Methanofervidicoccus sp. A16 TaxID=2607662 RepID=UPI00118926B0|nr:TIGR00303 family protein [Methanofervidicoccus sp. A16]AXI25394.1 TIGR00303 family protein [Methanofervidicoccus sp. A16]